MNLFGLGLIASTVAFLFKELFAERRRRRQRLLAASYVLIAASGELGFYVGKLKQLVEDIDAGLVNLPNGKLTGPSYSLYPEFIAGLRSNLTERKLIKSALFGSLGNCHFELSHIAQKLEANKARMRSLNLMDTAAVQFYAMNWKGLRELASQNIGTFESTSVELRLEAERLQAVVRNYELWFEDNLEALIASQVVGDARS